MESRTGQKEEKISGDVSTSATVMRLKSIPLNFLLQVIPGTVNNMNYKGRVSIIHYVKSVELERTKGELE